MISSVSGKSSYRAEAEVKRLRALGWTQNQIAVEVGLTQGTVSAILRRNGLGGPLVPIRRTRGKSP